ncbi:MAG: O-antigen ligase family protein [Phycisphaerae bacterium]|nr:O-antigen ligase family protein [Phycisphaerae bacterium]
MQIASQRVNLAMVILAVALSACTVWLIPTEYLPYWLGALGLVTAFAAYTFLGNPLMAVLAWFFAVTCIHEEFARLIVPSFFNLTIPRVFLALLVLLFAAMLGAGRLKLRWAWPTSLLMAVILLYFTLSAAVSGFQTIAVASVHYRLIAGYWFPVLVFGLMVQAVRTDRDIRKVLLFFFILGIYLTFTGWAEQFKLWSVVWPGFIADPDKGIHWGRVRGPFLASPIMGLAMVYVFYNNLVLARMSGPVFRLICRLAALATVPVVFWTQTRSVWLAMLVAGAIWVLSVRRGLSRVTWLSLILAVMVTGAAYNWRNIASGKRDVGGVTSLEPVYVRLGLLMISWDIFKDHPIVGVGFGHFRDNAVHYANNPSSPYYAFASSAMEHNNFLSILSECGLIGLILYVWLLIALLKTSLRLYRRLPASGSAPISRDIVVLYWALYADFFIDAMFRETSVSPFANALFFGLTGLIFALDHMLGPVPLPQRPAERPYEAPLLSFPA